MKEQELIEIIKAALSLEGGEINPERVAKRAAAYIAMSEKMGQPVKPVKPAINDWLLERLKEEQEKQITPTPYSPPKFVPPVTEKQIPKPRFHPPGFMLFAQKGELPEETKEEGEERLRTLMRKVELRDLGLLKEE